MPLSEVVIPERMCGSQAPILTAAFDYLRAGLSVIPVRADGSKAPAVPSWTQFQERQMTYDEARRCFTPGLGIAVIGGDVSGNLEILDFDEPDLFEGWSRLVRSTDDADLLNRLAVAETPSGGHHAYYRFRRSAADAPGNTKLAANEDLSTRIETRGGGGYAICAPSPAACHPDRRAYVMRQGTMTALPMLSENERDRLLNYARVFDLKPAAASPHTVMQARREPSEREGLRPGDDYNNRTNWPEILEPLGWRQAGGHGELTHWTRPGKQTGTSATTGLANDLLHVFSSNAAPFETERSYDRFGAFAAIHHSGDISAAARDLGGRGFGSQSPGHSAPVPQKPETALTVAVDKGPSELLAGVAPRLAGLPFVCQRNGITVGAAVTEAEIERGMKKLLRLQSEVQIWFRFALGDLYNALPQEYGRRAEWARSKFGDGGVYQQLRTAGWVSSRWSLERRDVGWQWSYFEATSGLSVGEQDFFVGRWLEGGLTLKTLRAEIRARKQAESQDITPAVQTVSPTKPCDPFTDALLSLVAALEPEERMDEEDVRLHLIYKLLVEHDQIKANKSGGPARLTEGL